MHDHHVAASDDAVTQLLFLVLVGVALAIHLAVALRRDTTPGPLLGGHVLMGAAMLCMLLPDGWDPVPMGAWAAAFCLAGVGFLGMAVLSWRSGDRAALAHHADLVVGAAAMVAMSTDHVGFLVSLTPPLAAYFLIQAVVGGGVSISRLAAVQAPVSVLSGAGRHSSLPRPAAASSSIATVAARALMATAMVYMLAGQ